MAEGVAHVLVILNTGKTINMQEEKIKPVQSKTTFSEEEKSDIEKNRKMAAISYLSILCLIPLLFRTKSKFVQFHARQGLILLFIEIVLPFFNLIPFFGQIIWVCGLILLLVLSFMGFKNAWQRRLWEMPYLGYYAKRLKL